jgi:hypothetical protein
MKRKLLVTLVASALELYAASAGAQVASCDLAPGSTSANAATPVRTGPMNPVNGFPEYVTESSNPDHATQLSVQRCLDPNFCFFDPVVASDPFSVQIGSGVEAFYWGATSVLSDVTGKTFLTSVFAAEAAFLSANNVTGAPVNGTQFPFLRLRFTFDAPADGVYTIRHPYGVDQFTVVGATGNRDVFHTIDKGLAPSATVQGSVGPFLSWANFAPVGFLGDGNPNAVIASDTVVGSPCGRNFVEITGVNALGKPIDFGGGQTIVTNDQFGVQGMIYDGRVQTPLIASRQTYSRSAAAGGQIDTFAVAPVGANVTVQDGPTIPLASSKIPVAVTMDKTAIIAPSTDANDSSSVVVLDAAALPPIVSITAADSALVPATDPTTLNVKLVDFVNIGQADYDPATGILAVSAATGDLRTNPSLTLREFGTVLAAGSVNVTTVAPPAIVHVDSAAGGSAVAQVRVIKATPPAAPTGLAFVSATSRTMTLSWTDASNNETGFNIYAVAATGARTLLGSTTANITTATVTGLTPATTYTIQVDSVNAIGFGSSTTISASTLALPLAPATVSFTLSTTAQRTLNLVWADTATDETGYLVYRRVGTTGAFTLLTGTALAPAPLPAGSTSYTDATGLGGTVYNYQVIAVRGPDQSAPTITTNTAATPTAPTSPGTPTGTASGSSVTVAWGDRSNNEDTFQVYRRTGAAGAFGTVSGLLPATTGGSVATPVARSFADSPVSNGTYNYRVDVSNWAATVQSAVSGNVVVAAATLLAPTNLAASTATRSILTWTDNSTGESGYRVQRGTQTVTSGTGVITEAALTNLTPTALGANAGTFTDTGATAGTLYRYVVTPLNGAATGPTASVYQIPGGFAIGNARVSAGANNGQISVSWNSPGTAIAGYTVERCATAGANCASFNAPVTLGAGATSTTLTGTSGQTYVVRITANSGKLPGATTPFATSVVTSSGRAK